MHLVTLLGTGAGTSDEYKDYGSVTVIRRAPQIFCLPLDDFSGGGTIILARLAGMVSISTRLLDLSFDCSFSSDDLVPC